MPWWVFSSYLAWLSLRLVNKKVRNRLRGVDELYSFYLLRHANGQTHVCLIALSIKIITKHVAVVYWFKSVSIVPCWDLYACSWAVIQLVLLSEYDDYDRLADHDRLEDHFIMYRLLTSQTTKYVTFYVLTNRITHYSTCNLPITAASLYYKHN